MLFSRLAVSGEHSSLGLPFLFLAAALGCTILESVTAFDQFAQIPFFEKGVWAISKAFHAEYKLFLYTGPKIFIGIVGGGCFFLFLASFSDRYRVCLQKWRQPALLVFGSILAAPAIVAGIKAVSGVFSPIDLLPYGGTYPHIGLIEQLWLFGTPAGGRSFPAGHASGGFALMALYFLPLRGVWKRILFCLGFAGGWAMGLYQMARGEHFLSHTLTTLFLTLAVISALSRLFLKNRS